MVDKDYYRANPHSSFRPIAPHPQYLRNCGPKGLLCMRTAFLHTTREPENPLGRAVQNKRKDQARVVNSDSRLFFDADEA